MKIGRYVVCPASAEKEVRNLGFTKDKNNIVELMWEWPADRSLKLMLVFSGGEGEDFTLAEALERKKPKILTRKFDKMYKEQLLSPRISYTLYPAAFGENDEIMVVDQKNGNHTQEIIRHFNVTAEIEENGRFLGSVKTVEFKMHSPDLHGFKLGDALFYTVAGTNRKYPIDNDVIQMRANVTAPKGSQINIVLKDEFKDIVRLQRT